MSLTGLAGVRVREIRGARTALAEADSETASSEGATRAGSVGGCGETPEADL